MIQIFLCKNCGHIFEQHQQFYEDPVEYFGFPCREISSGCPNCGSGSTDIATKCSICADWITGKYITTDLDEDICENCYREHNALD